MAAMVAGPPGRRPRPPSPALSDTTGRPLYAEKLRKTERAPASGYRHQLHKYQQQQQQTQQYPQLQHHRHHSHQRHHSHHQQTTSVASGSNTSNSNRGSHHHPSSSGQDSATVAVPGCQPGHQDHFPAHEKTAPSASLAQGQSLGYGQPLQYVNAKCHLNHRPPQTQGAVGNGPAGATTPRLEDYVLDRVIGAGGSSTVLRASPVTDPSVVVALKAVAKKSLSRRAQRYLAREIAVHRAIANHPNIVDLYEVFENKSGIYLVLELLRGGDLYAALRRERRGLDERVALAIIIQVLDALAHVHSLGVSHRDIKLENIVLVRKTNLHPPADSKSNPPGAAQLSQPGNSLSLLTDEFRVKLIDFGLACVRNPGAPPTDRLTREKCGTLRYAAPEVFGDTPYAPERADIWSVGVVLYSIIAHRHPYAASSGKDVMHVVANTDLRLEGSAFAGVSDDTKNLIRRLLSKDACARPDARAAVVEARRILDLLPPLPCPSLSCSMSTSDCLPSRPNGCELEASPVKNGNHGESTGNQKSAVRPESCASCVSGEASCHALRSAGPPPTRTPAVLDAISSSMSGDPAKSQGRLAAPADDDSDPPTPTRFNLGDVVRGLFEAFNRPGSPSPDRCNANESTVIDQSDSDVEDSDDSSDMVASDSTGTIERAVSDEMTSS